MKARLTHSLHDNMELFYGETRLFRYVYMPKTDQYESPKPYFHPLYTLAGNKVSIFRPYDHIWHKGIAMTASHLSGENFWGGGSYVHGQGYVDLDNNGRIQHRTWENIECDGNRINFNEQLQWITYAGETWIDEERNISVNEIDPEKGYWSLDFGFRLKNVRGETLTFASPTTKGRPMAGYGGLFWRGPRSFLNGTIMAAHGLEGPEVMGKSAAWLAFIGSHDGNEEVSTILFLDHPDNLRFPNKWFVRNDPYACVSFSFMFNEEYELEAGDELVLNYRILLGNGEWSRERIEEYWSQVKDRKWIG